MRGQRDGVSPNPNPNPDPNPNPNPNPKPQPLTPTRCEDSATDRKESGVCLSWQKKSQRTGLTLEP